MSIIVFPRYKVILFLRRNYYVLTDLSMINLSDINSTFYTVVTFVTDNHFIMRIRYANTFL